MKKILTLFFCFATYLVFSQNSDDTTTQSIKKDTLLYLEKLADSSFVLNFNGDYSKAIKTNLKLLKLAEQLNHPYYLHRGYSILGYNYLAQRDTIGARRSFEKSEEYASLSKNDIAIGRTYLDIANLYRNRGNLAPQSFRHYNKAIRIFERVKDSSSLATAHYNSIVASMQAKNYDKAFHHMQEIQKYLKNIEDDSFCEISVHSQMADYYTHKKDFLLADKYYAMVLKDCKEKEYWQELVNTYDKYATYLFDQGRYEEAYKAKSDYVKYFKKNEDLRQSEENQALIRKFEIESYKKEAIKAENEKKYLNQLAAGKNQRNTWLTVLSFALIVVFIYLLAVLTKKKYLLHRLKDENIKYLTAKKKAETLSKSKGKFLSTVSHELRTPLYGVIGLTSILLEDKTLNHQKDNLKSLKFSADYLMALINDVLQINKIDATDIEEEKKTFCLKKLLETMISSFQYKRNQNNNRIHLQIHPNTPDLIAGNDSHLSQLMMNIIGNALKFTSNGDIYINIVPLNITTDKLDIRFTIKDTGIGIAKDKQKLVYDEFLQVSGNIDTDRQGTGLGLAIVKKILQKYNSKIELESELGKGTSFSFVLPFELIQQDVTEEFEIPVSFTDTTHLKNKKILIVDDNAINRIVTQKILEKEEVICNQAKNGKEATEMVKIEDYDLVLMDVNMPVMDGIQATKVIRKFDSWLPIVALTAVEIDDMRDVILDSGMNDIVLKPYNIANFHRTIITCILQANKQHVL